MKLGRKQEELQEARLPKGEDHSSGSDTLNDGLHRRVGNVIKVNDGEGGLNQ